LRQRQQIQRHQRGVAGRELDIAGRFVAGSLFDDRWVEPLAARVGIAPGLVIGRQCREQTD
jgi:hypothetical protein